MKLNNKGWGIREMLVLSAVLIFFFGVAIYFIYLLYSSLDLDLKDDSDYVDVLQYVALEDNLEEAALEYLEDLNQVFDADVVIFLKDLVAADYISGINDPNTGNACDGYVEVNENIIYPYIKCDKYITNGYEE